MRTQPLLRSVLTALLLIVTLSSIAQQKEPIREGTEWLDIYFPHTNDKALPRVLLIGESITRGYYPDVEKLMQGKAYVARIATSKSIGDPALLKELELAMSYGKFDIIQFNNGTHGFGYTEEEYKKAFPEFLQVIRKNAGNAKLMWATLTPIRTRADANIFLPVTERIKVRNQIALEFIKAEKDIRINDLFTPAYTHPEYYAGGDGGHPVPSGYLALAQQVAAELTALMEEKK